MSAVDASLTPEQAARIARCKALSDAERENVLFLLAITAAPQLDSAIWAVARPSQMAGGTA